MLVAMQQALRKSAGHGQFLLAFLVYHTFVVVTLADTAELKDTEFDKLAVSSIDGLSTSSQLQLVVYPEYNNVATEAYNSPKVCSRDACLVYSQLWEVEDCCLNCTRDEALTFAAQYLSSCNPSFGLLALSKTREYVYKRRVWILKVIRQKVIFGNSSVLKDCMQDFMDMLSLLMSFSAIHGEHLSTQYFMTVFGKEQGFEDSYINANELCGQLVFFQEALDILRQPKQSRFALDRIVELNPNATSLECIEAFVIISEQDKLKEYLEEEYLSFREELRVASLFRKYINAGAFWFIVLTGLVWNGTLLLIFARHKELRTPSNLMLFNVVIVDILSLIAVPPVRYITMYYSPTIFMGPQACRVYMFFAVSLRFAAEFSLLSLTAQRFTATTASMKELLVRRPSAWCRSRLHILAVWLASFIFALPLLVFTFREDACFYYTDGVEGYGINILYMVVSSVVVPIAILVLSALMSRKLRHSVDDELGTGRCHGSQDLARNRSARVLLAMALLFIVAHCPRTIWCGLVSLQIISRRRVIFLYLEEIFAYLFFLNSGLNPIAMYIVSDTYRKLFNRYLLPCCSPASENIEKVRQFSLLNSHLGQDTKKF